MDVSGADGVSSSSSAPSRSYHPVPKYRGHRFLGVLKEFQERPLNVIERAHAQYGEIVELATPIPGTHVFSIADPDLVQRVLVEDEKNFCKHPMLTKKFRVAFGPGLFTFSGKPWREIRQRQKPAFSREKINGHCAIYVNAAEKMLSTWPQHEPGVVDISAQMALVTLRVALGALFSHDIDNGDALLDAFEQMQRYARRLSENVVTLPRWLPTKDNVAFRKAEKTFEELAAQLLQGRSEGKQERQDLFDLIVQGAKLLGSKQNALRRICGEISNTLFAGQDTVASNLVYALQHLAEDPAALAKLEAEIAATLRGRTARMEDVATLEYTNCVVNEALRLYPAAWMQQRSNIEAIEHNGYRIPKNSVLLLSTWIVHRNPALWSEPAMFRPERFSKANSKDRHRFAFYPFGAGARKCIGYHMALQEIPIILATIIQRYTLLNVVNTAPLSARFTLRPESPVRVTVRAREKILGTQSGVKSRGEPNV